MLFHLSSKKYFEAIPPPISFIKKDIWNCICSSLSDFWFLKRNGRQTFKKKIITTLIYVIQLSDRVYVLPLRQARISTEKKQRLVARNQDNVSDWGNMSIRGLLFQ
jgi:hypothetical protein